MAESLFEVVVLCKLLDESRDLNCWLWDSREQGLQHVWGWLGRVFDTVAVVVTQTTPSVYCLLLLLYGFGHSVVSFEREFELSRFWQFRHRVDRLLAWRLSSFEEGRLRILILTADLLKFGFEILLRLFLLNFTIIVFPVLLQKTHKLIWRVLNFLLLHLVKNGWRDLAAKLHSD